MLVMSEKKPRGRKPDPNSKRSLGVPRHTMPRLVFHAPEAVVAALEAFVAEASPPTNSSSVLREALVEYLTKRGKLPPKA